MQLAHGGVAGGIEDSAPTRFTVSCTGSTGITASSWLAASKMRVSSSGRIAGRAASCTATCVQLSGSVAIALRTVSQRAVRPPSTTLAP